MSIRPKKICALVPGALLELGNAATRVLEFPVNECFDYVSSPGNALFPHLGIAVGQIHKPDLRASVSCCAQLWGTFHPRKQWVTFPAKGNLWAVQPRNEQNSQALGVVTRASGLVA